MCELLLENENIIELIDSNDNNFELFIINIMNFIKHKNIYNVLFHGLADNKKDLFLMISNHNKYYFEIIKTLQLIKNRINCKHLYKTRYNNTLWVKWNTLNILCNYYISIYIVNKNNRYITFNQYLYINRTWEKYNNMLYNSYNNKLI